MVLWWKTQGVLWEGPTVTLVYRHRSRKSYYLRDILLSSATRLQGGRARTYLCTCREDSHDCPAGSPRGRSYCMAAQDISCSDRCHSHAYSSWVIKILPEVRKSKSLKWCPRAQTKGQWRHHLRRMMGHLHSELLGEVQLALRKV